MLGVAFLVLYFAACGGGVRIPGSAQYLHISPDRQMPSSQGRVRTVALPDRDADEPDSYADEATSIRYKRDAWSSSDEIITQKLQNDSHNLAYIVWSTVTDTIFMVTKDQPIKSDSFSNFYVSHDYGKHFNLNNNLLGSGPTSVEDIYTSPASGSTFVLVDVTNKWMFLTNNDCVSFTKKHLPWSPDVLALNPTLPNVIAALDNSTKTLHITTDFGKTWNAAMSRVKSFHWGVPNLDTSQTIFVEQMTSSGQTSNVLKNTDLFKKGLTSVLISNVTEFELFDDYLFVVQNLSSEESLSLFVSHERGPFNQTIFPRTADGSKLLEREYYIADSSEEQVFVAVNHASNHTNLYISEVRGLKFSLSLERVLYFNGQSDVSVAWLRRYAPFRFLDFYRVAALRGVYISTQLEQGLVGKRHLRTVITHDKGGEWNYIEAPDYDSNNKPISCELPSCSLHLAMQFGQINPYIQTEPILSSTSAPGLLMATGMLGKTVGYNYGVYMSNTGGATWNMVLDDEYYYNFGDHGGVMVAALKYHRFHRASTKHLLFSWDEGRSWKKKNFSDFDIRVYGVITEPGEQTTVFTVFGDYPMKREWVTVRVDLRKELGNNCTKKDYVIWYPADEHNTSVCLSGWAIAFERRRRSHRCFNGENYDRPIGTFNCSCSREDYECDFNFEQYFTGGNCSAVMGLEVDTSPPHSCSISKTYTVSRGYRRVSGDTCIGGNSSLYEPMTLPCPQAVSLTSSAQVSAGGSLVTLLHNVVKFSVTISTLADSDSVIFRWDFGDDSTSTGGQGSRYSKASHQYSKTGDFVVTVAIFSYSEPTYYGKRLISVRSPMEQDKLHVLVLPSPALVHDQVAIVASYDGTSANQTYSIRYEFVVSGPRDNQQHNHTSYQPFITMTFSTAGNVRIDVVADHGAGSGKSDRISIMQNLVVIDSGATPLHAKTITTVRATAVPGKVTSSSNQLPTIVVGCVLGVICIFLLIGFVWACQMYTSSRKRYLRVATNELVYNGDEEDGPSLLDGSDDEDKGSNQRMGNSGRDDDDLLIA